ncbi:6016_t:CDS:2 [Paraglomus occultum]|uniref:6016_t:CDS:1 n=1 Tax=Paraglomus occultum TaxID=144539 RepID=A0A9N8VXD3_9GLOM|nr:6016_t:CDS:2 [Paraglomus occultum]
MSICEFENYHGFYVPKEGATKGVIVVQEWWGLNDNIKDLARQVADRGFHAIAPDLYHGKTAKTVDEASHLMTGLDWDDALNMIGAAARFLKANGALKATYQQNGVVGYCMGGAVSIAAAARVPEIDAAAPFYGIPPASIADPATIRIPLQLHFGAKDEVPMSSPKAVEKLEETLKSSNVEYELHIYDAGHAFMNKTRPEAYHQASAELAFERVITFFTQKL